MCSQQMWAERRSRGRAIARFYWILTARNTLHPTPHHPPTRHRMFAFVSLGPLTRVRAARGGDCLAAVGGECCLPPLFSSFAEPRPRSSSLRSSFSSSSWKAGLGW